MTTDTKKTDAKADNKPREIKAEIVQLADKIKKEITIDGSTGVATVPKELYANTLPDGLTVDTIKQLQDHNSQFAAASYMALGEASIPVMKKHKDLDRSTLDIPTVGKDHFSLTFDRSGEVRAPGGGDPKTVYGTGRVAFNMYGTKNRGELSKVRDMLSEKAAAALGKL